MSMEFCVQQMKSRVTFGSSVMTLNLEENLVAIFLSPKNEMQIKYWYRLNLHHMKCMTRSQILLTCDPQYFQGRIPFKFLQLLISSDFIGSLRGQSEMTLNGMSSDPHNGVNSLDLILWDWC